VPHATFPDACAIILSEIFTRADPYEGEDLEHVLFSVADVTLEPPFRPSTLGAHFPPGMEEMMRSCWATDADDRPTFKVLLEILEGMSLRTIGMSLFKRSADRKQQLRVLNDCFPPHIAEALKEGRKVKPEHRAMVTLFFSDIVGFTDISATLSPERVSDMLDRLCA
jgi:hypothetical protein